MPTILIVSSYRFFFFSGDRNEPAHVHVERDEQVAKFWLAPVRLDSSGGFKRKELNRIQQLIEENQARFVGAWNEYFGE